MSLKPNTIKYEHYFNQIIHKSFLYEIKQKQNLYAYIEVNTFNYIKGDLSVK